MNADGVIKRVAAAALSLAAFCPQAGRADPAELPLAQRNCSTCHGLAQLAYQRHTVIVWWAQIQRMRWINGAAVPGEQVAPLACELATAYPAAPAQALKEFIVLVLPIAAVLGGLAWRYRRRRANALTDKESG